MLILLPDPVLRTTGFERMKITGERINNTRPNQNPNSIFFFLNAGHQNVTPAGLKLCGRGLASGSPMLLLFMTLSFAIDGFLFFLKKCILVLCNICNLLHVFSGFLGFADTAAPDGDICSSNSCGFPLSFMALRAMYFVVSLLY